MLLLLLLDVVFIAIIFSIWIFHQGSLIFQVGELGLGRCRVLTTLWRVSKQFALYIHLLRPLPHDFFVRKADDKILDPRVALPEYLNRVRPFKPSVSKVFARLIRNPTPEEFGSLPGFCIEITSVTFCMKIRPLS